MIEALYNTIGMPFASQGKASPEPWRQGFPSGSFLASHVQAVLASSTLLVSMPVRYPSLGKEDTHGRPCWSGRVAGVERIFGQFSGALPTPGGPGSAGALYD